MHSWLICRTAWTHGVYPFFCGWTLGLLPDFSHYEYAAVDSEVQFSLHALAFNYFEHMLSFY